MGHLNYLAIKRNVNFMFRINYCFWRIPGRKVSVYSYSRFLCYIFCYHWILINNNPWLYNWPHYLVLCLSRILESILWKRETMQFYFRLFHHWTIFACSDQITDVFMREKGGKEMRKTRRSIDYRHIRCRYLSLSSGKSSMCAIIFER